MDNTIHNGTHSGSGVFTPAVLDSVEDMIAVLDKTGRIIAVNDAWKGFAAANKAAEPLSNGLGINYQDAYRQSNGTFSGEAQKIMQGIQSVLDGSKNTFKFEIASHLPDQKRWFLLKVSSLPTTEGGAVVSHIDITDRKHAEEALRESKERYRKLVSIMPMAVFTCDAEGLITFYNQCAAELWGREPKLFAPEDKYCGSFRLYTAGGTPIPHHMCPMGEAVIHGKPARNEEIMIERPDGTMIYASVNIDPLYDENGVRIGAINVFRDITEQKLLWEENQRQKEELEQRIKDRTRQLEGTNRTLLAEIEERTRVEAELEEIRRHLMDRVEAERLTLARELHDGPIQELYGLVYLIYSLKDPDKTGADWDADLTTIVEVLNRINQTLRTIMSDLRPPTLSPFGLEKSIREHVEILSRIHSQLRIQLDLKPDRRALSEPVRLSLFRIYQVAITNVIRHAQASQVSIRFSLADGEATLEIEDNGRGFELPKRWIKFAREGHLGLVGSFERAEAIGGRLEVISEPDKGTLIRVVAPVSQPALVSENRQYAAI